LTVTAIAQYVPSVFMQNAYHIARFARTCE
jgi:hypothetical protein